MTIPATATRNGCLVGVCGSPPSFMPTDAAEFSGTALLASASNSAAIAATVLLFTVVVFGQLALSLHYCALLLSTECRDRGAVFRQTTPSRSMSRSQRVSLRLPVGLLLRPHRFHMGVRLAIGILTVLMCCGDQTLFVEGELTAAEFKLATWEWVQDTITATTKWGDIGDWDTSGVSDFSYAFSTGRNQVGGSYAYNGNPKAATFVGTAISKWNTASATTLAYTFYGASEMNADLTGWKV